MGLSDREYYRGDEPAGFDFSHRTLVTNLVIINVGLFLLNFLISHQDNALTKTLELRPDVWAKPWLLWKLVTYGFVHQPGNLAHLVLNMFALWIFGREVEPRLGRGEFLRFYLTAIVLGGLVWSVRQFFTTDPQVHQLVSLVGASGGVTAVVLLFVLYYPRRQILLFMIAPVPAWVLGLIVVGLDAARMLSGEGGTVAVDVHLVGAAFAFAYHRLHWNIGRVTPSFGWLRMPSFKSRSRPELKLHDPEEFYQTQDEEADRILDKVNRQGIESLSNKERRILEDYSRRMRQKHS